MKTWKGYWYGSIGESSTPISVQAETYEEAVKKAYESVGGTPPQPLLTLQEVN